jgi:hypothetical protein
MLLYVTLLALAGAARATCLASCAAITDHAIYTANGTGDFSTTSEVDTCDGASVDLSSTDTAVFGFAIADDLWAMAHTFSSSTIRFKADINQTGDAELKIRIEEQGAAHTCNTTSPLNLTVSNETSVSWTVPNFTAGEYYSTPDLSSLLNSLTVCPTYVVFRFESLYGNGTAEADRKVVSFETLANATRLTLNAACPAGTTGVAATDAASTSPDNTVAIGVGAGAGALILITIGLVALAVATN